ncbi:MAG: phosphate acetyltransferase, partial [Slackia piriformis]|nr:phosphate acetyltransferase [Slackia piriformis]
MATFLNTMIERAKSDKKTIVLPEGNDDRVLEAARKIVDAGIADVIVVGNPAAIAEKGHNLEGVTVIDNMGDPLRKELAEGLFELRKAKGMTPEEADSLMDDVMYFGTMLLKTGRADGLVGGACHATK